MKATRLKPQMPDGLVRLTLPRGVVLILTTEDYRAALKKGKAMRRAERQAARETQNRARYEAQRLAWLERA